MAKVFRFKKQSAKGAPESGASAYEIRVVPGGQGLQRTTATIARQILDRSGMAARDRAGSEQAPVAYETELEARNADGIFMGIQGGPVTESFVLSESDVTSVAISASGTVATVGSGNLRTLGIRAGMLIKFGGLATSGNNAKWVPVLAVPTATTMSLGPSPQDKTYLADETADTAFTLTTSRFYEVPLPREKQYFTAEEYDDVKDQSKLTTDARFINLQISAAANQMVKLGFGLLGRTFEILDTADAPNFDANPVEGDALLLLDGVLLKNAVVAAQVTSLQLNLQAQGNITPMATSRTGADVGVGQFKFSSTLNELVNDYAALQAAIDESTISLFAAFVNRAAPSEIVSVYGGNLGYAQASDTIADDDSEESAQSATLYGGKDTRGEAAGYSASTLVFATTADIA